MTRKYNCILKLITIRGILLLFSELYGMLNLLQSFEHLIIMNNLNHTSIFFRNGYTSLRFEDPHLKYIVSLFVFFLNELYFYHFCCLIVLEDNLSLTLNEILSFFRGGMIILYLFCCIFAGNYAITSISSNNCQFYKFMGFRCLYKSFLETNHSWIIIVDDCNRAFYIVSG